MYVYPLKLFLVLIEKLLGTTSENFEKLSSDQLDILESHTHYCSRQKDKDTNIHVPVLLLVLMFCYAVLHACICTNIIHT